MPEKISSTSTNVEEKEVEKPSSPSDIAKESQDLHKVLSTLNLSAINNRVIGVSKDSQQLLENFVVVLKDIVKGVPTAFDDLEKLLNERQGQLDSLYGSLPPFLQSLVKSVPVKLYAMLLPQMAAAMKMQASSEDAVGAASFEASNSENEKSGKSKDKEKKRSYIPSLRKLVMEKGAVAAMLRSILNFLQLRFPAMLAGTNVLMSLAVFGDLYLSSSSIWPTC